jgi:Cu/Ag efflux protein CusF
MRRTVSTAICLAMTLALCLTAVSIQNPPAPPQNPPAVQNPPAQQAPADKNYQGQLAKVDATARQITVKGADNKEMIFTYNDKTQMTGIDNAPQGLSGKMGSTLRITYQESRGTNLASKVEVVPAK